MFARARRIDQSAGLGTHETGLEQPRRDLPGTTLAGHIRAARFAVEAGSAVDAETHARAALAIGDDVSPSDLYPAER